MEEGKNPAIQTAIDELFDSNSKGPRAVTHGEFNKRMFLEAMIYGAGTGCSIEKEDIIDYACMTEREFVSICNEFLTSSLILAEKNMYGILMFSLNLDMKQAVIARLDEPEIKQAVVRKERRKGDRRKATL